MIEPQQTLANPTEPIAAADAPTAQTSSTSSTWWLVCRHELIELWLRGRVLIFLLFFTLVLSITSVMREWESQLSSIPPREIIKITLISTITFGLFIGLILGADSISGERERDTLESLLLTPTSRRQIVVGKFLAALSPWPVAMLLAIPYLVVMAHGNAMLGKSLLLGSVLGSMVAIAFTSLGMLTSIWSTSNKNSLFISLLVYILFLIPTLWPGWAQKGDWGYFMQKLNPVQGTDAFLAKVIVNNRTIPEVYSYALAPIISGIVMPALLFLYAAPRLGLEGGVRHAQPQRTASAVRLATVFLIGLLTLALLFARTPPQRANAATVFQTDAGQSLQISVNMDHKVTQTGDTINFNTTVVNNGSTKSLPFNVSMNIIKIGSGDPVDPEDWSPERSQEVESLAAGASAQQSWSIDMILSGNYMVYMTVVPIPATPEATTQTASSKGIHFTVSQTSNANPGGVLPFAIGIPTALALLTLWVRRRTQRSAKVAMQVG